MNEVRRRRRIRLSVNRLIPNALTLLALCAGMTAIRMALLGKWEMAVVGVVVAMVLDGLDGRIARLMGGASQFGAELDSLADVINFGVAPALIIYSWSLHEIRGLGWAVALLLVMCCALRLARFNTSLADPDPPPWANKFFTGVPAPAGAGVVLLPLILSFELGEDFFAAPAVNFVMMALVSGLMVSRVPTFSAKTVRVPARRLGLVLLGLGILAAFLVSTPWATMGVAGLVYLASIPVSAVAHRRLLAALGNLESVDGDDEVEDEVDGDDEVGDRAED